MYIIDVSLLFSEVFYKFESCFIYIKDGLQSCLFKSWQRVDKHSQQTVLNPQENVCPIREGIRWDTSGGGLFKFPLREAALSHDERDIMKQRTEKLRVCPWLQNKTLKRRSRPVNAPFRASEFELLEQHYGFRCAHRIAPATLQHTHFLLIHAKITRDLFMWWISHCNRKLILYVNTASRRAAEMRPKGSRRTTALK